MAEILQNLDPNFLCLCEEMCFEYAEIWSETNSPSLIQSTLKFIEMETILLYSLNFVPSFYDPYSLFSIIPPSAKSK